MALKTFGTMGVDWEQRVDLDRLRTERLARAKKALADSQLGALLCFDMNNIRYITATHIGTWAIDKLVRFTLLPQNDEPIMWDFGSAARHHKLYNPWLGDERSRAGISTLRGSVQGRAEAVAEKIKVELEQRGLLGEPLVAQPLEVDALLPVDSHRSEGLQRHRYSFPTSVRASAATVSGVGTVTSSSTGENGIGTSRAQSRRTGASRS